MKTPKHTKGPWHLHAGVIAGENVVWSKINETPIAIRVNDDNAHLIAAAPEMLEALKSVALFLSGIQNVLTDERDIKDRDNAIDQVLCAIEKARGES